MMRVMWSKIWLSLALLVLLTRPSLSSEKEGMAAVASKVVPAVVLIKGTDSHGAEISGSGFIVDPSGTIVTNLHVIRDFVRGGVKLANGDVYDQMSVKAFDERKDLAVIQIAGYNLPTMEIGDSETVQVGDSVLLVGNPLGTLEGSASAGIISGIRQMEEGYRVIQTDAAANPGNSGGPMVDSKGRAVGIVTFKLKGTEALNFVVPVNYVRGLLAGTESIPVKDLASRLGLATDLFSSKQHPRRWKSLNSGTVKIVRLEGEHLYVETVLPEELIKAGDFTLADLKRDGSKFSGTVRSKLTCTFRSAWDLRPIYKKCVEEAAIVIESLTENRIEGYAEGFPDGDELHCRTCSHSEGRQKIHFVWIPE